MFQYDVISEQEAMAERFQLLKEGEYDAVITESQDTRSSNSGNPMMDMIVTVYDESGRSHEVRDFLVFTKSMMWKVINFSNSAEVTKQYEEGQLCSNVVINKRVKVKISIEQGKEIPVDKLNGKPIGSKYFDKNKIEDYIKKDVNKIANNTNEQFYSDDIPLF